MRPSLICSFALLAWSPVDAAPLPDPCKILTKSDIQNVLHGTVHDPQKTRINRAPGPGSSTHCDYMGTNGNVYVVVHDDAEGYPGTNPVFKQMGLRMQPLNGLGVPALLTQGHTASFVKNRTFAQVELIGAAAKNDAALVALAKIAASRIP